MRRESLEQDVADLFGGQSIGITKSRFQAAVAEFIISAIAGFQDTVGEEDENVAWHRFDDTLVKPGRGKHAEGDADGVDDFHLSTVEVDWSRQAGVGKAQNAALVVPRTVHQRNVAIVQRSLHE